MYIFCHAKKNDMRVSRKYVSQKYIFRVVCIWSHQAIGRYVEVDLRIFVVGPNKNFPIFGRGHNGANEPYRSLRGFSFLEITWNSLPTSSPPRSAATLCDRVPAVNVRDFLHKSRMPKRKLIRMTTRFPKVRVIKIESFLSLPMKTRENIRA